MLCYILLPYIKEEENRRCHEHGSRRYRQPLEGPALNGSALNIEPGQSQRAAYDVEEGGQPTVPPERLQRPGKYEHPRRDTKGDKVGEGVVLHSKLAARICQSRHPSIEAVKNGGDEYGDGRPLKPAVETGNDRVEAAKEAK